MVEGKGFVGPTLHFHSLLRVTRLQIAAERGTRCNTGANDDYETTGAHRLTATAALLVCWAGTAPAQPLPGGLPLCRAQLSACQAGAQAFPATGQTTCWNSAGAVISCTGTGQDGDIQAGATLSYTDNGDGTITDNNTKLVWEKQSVAEGSIHDMDNAYTWADAFAVHVAGLNAANFAGHNDWRLPNVKELLSIVDYQNRSPAVAPAFHNESCIGGASALTASCTRGEPYWSSTTSADTPNFAPTFAHFVNFLNGFVSVLNKSDSHRVRAVRGGSNLSSSQQ
jgi:Protein of unknown function (DUF1566)